MRYRAWISALNRSQPRKCSRCSTAITATSRWWSRNLISTIPCSTHTSAKIIPENAVRFMHRTLLVLTSHIYNPVVTPFQIRYCVTWRRHRILEECTRTPQKPLERLITDDKAKQVLLYERIDRIPRSYCRTAGLISRTKAIEAVQKSTRKPRSNWNPS